MKTDTRERRRRVPVFPNSRTVTKLPILLGFRIRSRGGDRRGHRGLLRGGSFAVRGFVRAAAGY